MYKTIAFDVDGVMADLTGHFVSYYNMLHKDDQITKGNIINYNLTQNLKYKDRLWDMPGFIETLPLFPEAAYYFQKINEDYEAIVVTACDEIKREERINWFKNNFPEFDTDKIFFEKDKTKIRFDVIFEDSPSNIEAIGADRSVKYEHIYNCNHAVAKYKVANWEEIFEWVVSHCEPKCKKEVS